jgi:hypothetical protein
MKRPVRLVLEGSAALLMLVIMGAGLFCIVLFDPPATEYRLEKLTVAMTKAEVESILGSPDSQQRSGRIWVYQPRWWPAAYVYFDDDDRFFYAGLED